MKNFGNAFNGKGDGTGSLEMSEKVEKLQATVQMLTDRMSKNTTPGRVDTIYVVIDKSRK